VDTQERATQQDSGYTGELLPGGGVTENRLLGSDSIRLGAVSQEKYIRHHYRGGLKTSNSKVQSEAVFCGSIALESRSYVPSGKRIKKHKRGNLPLPP